MKMFYVSEVVYSAIFPPVRRRSTALCFASIDFCFLMMCAEGGGGGGVKGLNIQQILLFVFFRNTLLLNKLGLNERTSREMYTLGIIFSQRFFYVVSPISFFTSTSILALF